MTPDWFWVHQLTSQLIDQTEVSDWFTLPSVYSLSAFTSSRECVSQFNPHDEFYSHEYPGTVIPKCRLVTNTYSSNTQCSETLYNFTGP